MAVPFWLFRDANFGTPMERRANYRHNRERRGLLPFFLFKWLGLAFCLLQAMIPLSQMMATLPHQGPAYWSVTILCMLNGMAFAFACVVITILLAGYLYLSWIEE